MDFQQQDRFFQGLLAMSELFTDPLTTMRQKLYWHLLSDKLAIEEWEYACHKAMQAETFYKVPLPAALMEYVREYRASQKQTSFRDEMPDGSHTREQLLQLREALIAPEEIRQLIQSALPGYGWEPPEEP